MDCISKNNQVKFSILAIEHNQYFMYKFIFIMLITLGFLSCKRSNHQQIQREYDGHLIQTLRKLEQKYAGKKVRVNTWDTKTDAYQDIYILDENQQPTEKLTIGDSVKFVGIDLSQADGIRAEIKLLNNKIGYIPYHNIEEFEPATKTDPDLKN